MYVTHLHDETDTQSEHFIEQLWVSPDQTSQNDDDLLTEHVGCGLLVVHAMEDLLKYLQIYIFHEIDKETKNSFTRTRWKKLIEKYNLTFDYIEPIILLETKKNKDMDMITCNSMRAFGVTMVSSLTDGVPTVSCFWRTSRWVTA